MRNDQNSLHSSSTLAAPLPFWLRIEGGESNIDSAQSTTDADFETDYGKIKLGVNQVLKDTHKGRFIVGLNGSYSQADSDIRARAGRSDIDTDGYSAGVTATWYAASDSSHGGLYIDTQLQRSWYDTDLSGDAVRGSVNNEGADSIKNIDSDGYSASLEVGKRAQLQTENKVSITPQAQLVYSKVDFDAFTGRNRVSVESDSIKSLKVRLGLAVSTEISHKAGSQTQGYLVTNLIHEFENDSNVSIVNASLSNEVDRWQGEIGSGLSHTWHQGNKVSYELFGEVTASTSLEHVGDSNAIKGLAGFRMNF